MALIRFGKKNVSGNFTHKCAQMKQFYLKDKSFEFQLGFGFYQIYFTGGWYIKNLEELNFELIDLDANQKIILKSKNIFGLRKQDYIGGQKAVQVFEFNLAKPKSLKISINNPETLIMKKVHPFMFIYSILFPRKIETDIIQVIIK